MNSKNLLNRIITSIILIFLLVLSFNYTYILIISLTLVSLISWIEFKGLIAKIFKKNSLKVNINKFFFNGISLIYLTFFSVIIFSGITQDNFKINILYLFIICICSDVGGLLFGKIFKGKS